MKKLIYNLLILGALFISTQVYKAQQLLEALDAPLEEKLDLPPNWNIEIQPIRYLASVYDNNYFPMNTLNLGDQPVIANTGSSAPDGTNDPLLNYQGKIGTYTYSKSDGKGEILGLDETFEKRLYAVKINFIPSSINAQPLKIPSTLSEAVIPAQYIKNSNQDVKVYLKVYFGNIDLKVSGDTELKAFVVAEKNIDLVQLDMNQGIGKDGKGILLTKFDVAGKTMELRLLPGMPDKYANRRTNTYVAQGANLYQHDMFYMPVIAADNKVWLNNNLGANYSNLKHPDFNPLQQAKHQKDQMALGSYFQWSRNADGHEIQEHNRVGEYFQTETSDVLAPNWKPDHDKFIAVPDPNTTTKNEWHSQVGTQPDNLWRGENNPCPVGFAVPFSSEWRNYQGVKTGEYRADIVTRSPAIFNDQELKFTIAGEYTRAPKACINSELSSEGLLGVAVYGASTKRTVRGLANVLSCGGMFSGNIQIGNRGSKVGVGLMFGGSPLRCIKK